MDPMGRFFRTKRLVLQYDSQSPYIIQPSLGGEPEQFSCKFVHKKRPFVGATGLKPNDWLMSWVLTPVTMPS